MSAIFTSPLPILFIISYSEVFTHYPSQVTICHGLYQIGKQGSIFDKSKFSHNNLFLQAELFTTNVTKASIYPKLVSDILSKLITGVPRSQLTLVHISSPRYTISINAIDCLVATLNCGYQRRILSKDLISSCMHHLLKYSRKTLQAQIFSCSF